MLKPHNCVSGSVFADTAFSSETCHMHTTNMLILHSSPDSLEGVGPVLAVGLRIASKRIAHNPFGIDDWLLIIALLVYFTAEVLVVRSDILGRQASSPEDNLYRTYLKYVYIYSVFYFVVIALVEVSILLFYRRIFFPSHYLWSSAVLIGIAIAWFITGLVIEIGYPSHPIGYYFAGSAETTFHINYLKFWLAMAVIEVVLEIAILVLPIRAVSKLQLSLKKKLLCTSIFALGGFVIITGIIRIVKVYKVTGVEVDLTQGDIWLNVHLGTAIICACLPTYRPLISKNPWFSKKRHGYRTHPNSETSNKPYKLPSVPKSVYHGGSNELMTAVYAGHQPALHGNFADARRSDSTGATKTGWFDESLVRTGEAIRVKQTFNVV
ncbi:MAG: hypothetical protein L6R39_007432 [Caloplaca ligustica]|nr:MAG: hypothetical protein L6R39_007432 [Caloplaca ligustica]